MKTFYMLHADGPQSHQPMRRHATMEEAEREAARIAHKENKAVHILQLVKSCTPKLDVTWTPAEEK
jgi:hypothetical protein